MGTNSHTNNIKYALWGLNYTSMLQSHENYSSECLLQQQTLCLPAMPTQHLCGHLCSKCLPGELSSSLVFIITSFFISLLCGESICPWRVLSITADWGPGPRQLRAATSLYLFTEWLRIPRSYWQLVSSTERHNCVSHQSALLTKPGSRLRCTVSTGTPHWSSLLSKLFIWWQRWLQTKTKAFLVNF